MVGLFTTDKAVVRMTTFISTMASLLMVQVLFIILQATNSGGATIMAVTSAIMIAVLFL